jgi:hypothetical protein
MLSRPSNPSSPVEVHAQNFELLSLSHSVALLTYQSAQVGPSGALERHANRCSLWRREPQGWQMVFHQGSPTEGFANPQADVPSDGFELPAPGASLGGLSPGAGRAGGARRRRRR